MLRRLTRRHARHGGPLSVVAAALFAAAITWAPAASAGPHTGDRPVRLTTSTPTTTVEAPGTVTFSVRAANTGQRTLHQLVLVNAVDVAGQPAGALCTWSPAIDAPCAGAMGTGYAHIPDLSAGQTLTWRVRVRVPLRFSGARTTNAGKHVRLYLGIMTGHGAQGTQVSNTARRSINIVDSHGRLPMTGAPVALMLISAAGFAAAGLAMTLLRPPRSAGQVRASGLPAPQTGESGSARYLG